MRLRSTRIEGVVIVEPEPHHDERGSFSRIFDRGVVEGRSGPFELTQASLSHNIRAGTVRGLHWQEEPHGEVKIVRAVAGAILDIVVDMRHDSPTRTSHVAVELSAANRLALVVPIGCAHGFQTLVDDTEVLYMMDGEFVPDAARGARWDDPALAIEWPPAPGGRIVSDRDASFPDLVA